MRSRPSGSSFTAPIRVGTPTRATTSRTARIVCGSLVAAGSSAPSPHTARSGGSLASRACAAMLSWATPMSSLAGFTEAARRTSTCSVATSSDRPSGLPNGSTIGATTTKTAMPAARRRRRPSPPPAIARIRPFTSTTTKETPQTPATVARRTVAWLFTWLMPSVPHVNPPSGHSPRSHSKTVHRAAQLTAFRTGLPVLRSTGATSPNAPAHSAISRVSAIQAIDPNRQIQ